MAGILGEYSNSSWKLEDLKELEQALGYDIASGFSDLEIGLNKDSQPYNMSDVLSLPLFNEGSSEHDVSQNPVVLQSPHREKKSGSSSSSTGTTFTYRPVTTVLSQGSSLPFPIGKGKKEEKSQSLEKIVIVLLAQTAFGTKQSDEAVTYLNKGQVYEMKLFTAEGDSKENLYKSVVRLCFYERKYQFSENEQIITWQMDHIGERMLQLDPSGCYGMSKAVQDEQNVNVVHFLWSPEEEAILAIRVNCLSTEFSARKHGGEKGVPLQIMVDTFLVNSDGEPQKHIHRSYCQIKVFKDKGAERKHKMDQQRLGKISSDEINKYKPAYQITLLKEVPVPQTKNFAGLLSSLEQTSTVSSRSTPQVSIISPNKAQTSPGITMSKVEPPVRAQCSISVANSPPSTDKKPLVLDATNLEIRQWLVSNRFTQYIKAFANFSVDDMLRMNRRDLMDVCGTGDGIRLYNLLRKKPRLTLYVAKDDSLYQAILLETLTLYELVRKLSEKFGLQQNQVHSIARLCMNGIPVAFDDAFIATLDDESAFALLIIQVEGTNQYRLYLKDIPANPFPGLDPDMEQIQME